MRLSLNKVTPLDGGLSLGLGLLLTITIFLGLQSLASDWSLTHQTTTLTITPPESNAALQADIINSHLFGQNLTADGNLPVTNLDCRVTSISKVFNEKGEDISRATIAIAGNGDKMVQVGDALPDGVKIVSIESNAVILENDGRLEKLPLPRTQLTFLPAPRSEMPS